MKLYFQTQRVVRMKKWSFWIDRGGTFTDIVAKSPSGKIYCEKLLSENPSLYSDATIFGIKKFLNVKEDVKIPLRLINSIKMGTTVATNALLERKGSKVVLAITQGLGDQLRLGYQNRPDLFARKVKLPDQLYSEVIEAKERVLVSGEIVQRLEKEHLKNELSKIFSKGIVSCAIVFMHSYKYPRHEIEAYEIAKEIGFTQISVSHKISPLIKIVSRGDTTVVDAYLSPVLNQYIESILSSFDKIPRNKIQFMKSSGGLTDAKIFRGKDAILSGPAGGVVGAIMTSKIAEEKKVIGFDMGGTSTDVCHYAGDFERSLNTEVAGVRLAVPMMNIHTVAAGGGSILSYQNERLQVGPESVGAFPGPSCYGNGGALSITDANLVTGRIRAEYFPKIFGPDNDQGLDYKAAILNFEQTFGDLRGNVEAIADGFLRIAVENMANAIKKISVQRGYDVSDYCLTVFGGAGSQHVCAISERLGISKCLIHPQASLLSAYGMGYADIRATRSKSLEQTFTQENLEEADRVFSELSVEAIDELKSQNVKLENVSIVKDLLLKVKGTDTALRIRYDAMEKMQQNFMREHYKRFGFEASKRQLIVETVSLEAIGAAADLTEDIFEVSSRDELTISADAINQVYLNGAWVQAKFFRRNGLLPGDKITGPAIIIEEHTSIFIESGWRAEITKNNYTKLVRLKKIKGYRFKDQPDGVMLEVFNNLYMSIAEQMGAILEKTAQSITIKERLDFSCAVFDENGDLIANAPHMPVHLGSMDSSVKTIIKENEIMSPGDAYALNAPYNGGTHLPDITVVSPVWIKGSCDIKFFVAARGHHTDVGGLTPGSMPPDSSNIMQEGVYIDNWKLVESKKFREKETRELLSGALYPVRSLDINISDLKAQIAACEKGQRELQKMVDQYGWVKVKRYLKFIKENASKIVKTAICMMSDTSYVYPMDNDIDGEKRIIKISVKIDKIAQTATIDFTGTSAQLNSNYNAPSPVTKAAVLYAFRILAGGGIPMNSGVLEPLNIILPKGTMLSPEFPAAVIAGNVETSQAVTSALLLAFGIQAASQSTMNNVTWGNSNLQYYETICGGTGAGIEFDGKPYNGTSGVHSHMTNSRLTDPEVLEGRFPVVLEQFSIRSGSGGSGKYVGGNGVIRRIRFLEEMTLAILAGHREIKPPGLNEGKGGKLGISRITRFDGTEEILKPADKTTVYAGDILCVLTPGGGGMGKV